MSDRRWAGTAKLHSLLPFAASYKRDAFTPIES